MKNLFKNRTKAKTEGRAKASAKAMANPISDSGLLQEPLLFQSPTYSDGKKQTLIKNFFKIKSRGRLQKKILINNTGGRKA